MWQFRKLLWCLLILVALSSNLYSMQADENALIVDKLLTSLHELCFFSVDTTSNFDNILLRCLYAQLVLNAPENPHEIDTVRPLDTVLALSLYNWFRYAILDESIRCFVVIEERTENFVYYMPWGPKISLSIEVSKDKPYSINNLKVNNILMPAVDQQLLIAVYKAFCALYYYIFWDISHQKAGFDGDGSLRSQLCYCQEKPYKLLPEDKNKCLLKIENLLSIICFNNKFYEMDTSGHIRYLNWVKQLLVQIEEKTIEIIKKIDDQKESYSMDWFNYTLIVGKENFICTIESDMALDSNLQAQGGLLFELLKRMHDWIEISRDVRKKRFFRLHAKSDSNLSQKSAGRRTSVDDSCLLNNRLAESKSKSASSVLEQRKKSVEKLTRKRSNSKIIALAKSVSDSSASNKKDS